MTLGAQIASITFALFVFGVVFEMVRRRYLRERYAILWLVAALLLLVLAAWTGLLRVLASAVGIATPSNAFFVVAFAFLLLLLLHFTAVVSRLSDETRVLAQRLSLLEQRTRTVEDAHTQEPSIVETPDGGDSLSQPAAERVRAGSRS
jgi:hypothetical protein